MAIPRVGSAMEDEVPSDDGNSEGTTADTSKQAAPNLLLLLLLCAAGFVEGADVVLLPAVNFALQLDLGLTLSNLATVALCQAALQSAGAPFWGVLADQRLLSRKAILVLGFVLQGCITMALAGINTVLPMAILRAFNGLMLAALRPVACAIIADVTCEEGRGKAFGWMQFAMCTGTVLGSLVGTPLSMVPIWGLAGWRAVFLFFGALAVLLGAVLAALLEDPERPPRKVLADDARTRFAVFWEEAACLLSYLRYPTFCLIVLQGIFGCMPWTALNFQTTFFQLSGLGNERAALLQAFNQGAQAFGGLLGGHVGDRLAARSRHHGRPLTAQLSVLSGIPLTCLVFVMPPPMSDPFWWYLPLVVAMGLLTTWCASGVNWPILSEVVDVDRRATVIAWETALEGAAAAVVGNAVLAWLAEDAFGYDLEARAQDAQIVPENAVALGKALAITTAGPWLACLCFYSLLHWSYQRDLRKMQKVPEQEKEAPAAGSLPRAALPPIAGL